MGYYIETPQPKGKVKQLEELYGASVLNFPMERISHLAINSDEALICVVTNPEFEAAGIIYDGEELERFRNPEDPRPKVWMLMDREKVKELNPNAPL